MRYRTLGKTGLDVSEIVFGGGAVGGLLIRADDDTRRQAVTRALEAGVNWIDTAPMYGEGASEEAIGWLLAERSPSERPHIATKALLNPEAGDLSGQVERSLVESLKRLQMNSVDLLQVHNLIYGERGRGNGLSVDDMLEPVRRGLERVRDAGLTRHVGFTANGEPTALRAVVESGFYETAQVYYNMINPSAGWSAPSNWSGHDFENLIGLCQAKDVGVLVIRALAAGVLATDVRHGREGEIIPKADVESNERKAAMLMAAVGQDEGTRAQIAVRFALSNPGVSGVVVGMAELDHLMQALGAVERGPLPAAALERLRSTVAADFVD
ncbi:MAG: aldo/keto reductase [Candidatus Latescibacterota bacterium]|nr:aldo/keto reductase [Candidatus Latescibacterota bacterium]MEE2725641.1 aldo/keto reductase [Candidatus Latescibacterota bacterium]